MHLTNQDAQMFVTTAQE